MIGRLTSLAIGVAVAWEIRTVVGTIAEFGRWVVGVIGR